MLMPTTAPDKCAMKLGWGPEEGSGGEKRSQTARPTSELTVANKAETADGGTRSDVSHWLIKQAF